MAALAIAATAEVPTQAVSHRAQAVRRKDRITDEWLSVSALLGQWLEHFQVYRVLTRVEGESNLLVRLQSAGSSSWPEELVPSNSEIVP